MSHAVRMSPGNTGAPSPPRPALATLALVIPVVLLCAVALVVAWTGTGAGTQSTVVSDRPDGAAPAVHAPPSRGSAAFIARER